MSKLVVDKATLAKLNDLREQMEIYDESGRILGRFEPATDRRLYQDVQVPFSNEDLDRFEREPGGRSLAEILADLEQQT